MLGIDGLIVFFDSILITGHDPKEHYDRLRQVLSMLKENGLTIEKKQM